MTLDALTGIGELLGRDGRNQLLRLGVTHGERARAALANALATGDDARARSEAHGLRGAVAPFGAAELAALLRRVEDGEPVPAGEVDASVAAFVTACRTALDS